MHIHSLNLNYVLRYNYHNYGYTLYVCVYIINGRIQWDQSIHILLPYIDEIFRGGATLTCMKIILISV